MFFFKLGFSNLKEIEIYEKEYKNSLDCIISMDFCDVINYISFLVVVVKYV